jgi:hypothetical protein
MHTEVHSTPLFSAGEENPCISQPRMAYFQAPSHSNTAAPAPCGARPAPCRPRGVLQRGDVGGVFP